MTGEAIERVAKAIIGTMFVEHELPLEDEIYQKYLVTARAAIEALREPTEAMGAAMLLARTYFEDMGNNPRLTEAAADKLRMGDHLAGNPSRWCMPDWRAGIDAALSGKPPEVTRK